jgi:hypothetical protein
MHPGVTRSLRLLGMPGRQEDNWGSSQRKVVKIVYRQTTLIPDENYGTKTIRESRVDGLSLAVVAVGVGAATVAVVDEAGGGHPEGAVEVVAGALAVEVASAVGDVADRGELGGLLGLCVGDEGGPA